MATINLTGRLSAISTNGGTITKSGSKYVVTGGVSVANGGIIDVPLLVDYLEFDGTTYPDAIATIGLKDTPSNGDFFPIEVEITSAGAWSYNTNYRTRGNITINTYNCIIKFTNANANASAFGVWPGSGVAQTGVKWNAENVDIICLAGQNAPTLNTSEIFPAGGGNLKNVTFQGCAKIFFTSSPISTNNVVNIRSTGVTYGFTVDTASFELIGGSSDYVAAQRIGTAIFTDFQVKNGYKIYYADQLAKTLVFKKRFAANIVGGNSFKFWVLDKNNINVLDATLDTEGKYTSAGIQYQSLTYTTGTIVENYPASNINTSATNLKSPFKIRAFKYGYRPMDSALVVDVTASGITTPHTLNGIAQVDPYQSETKANTLSITQVATASELYRLFFAWYEDNGSSINPSAIPLPTGGDIYNFIDYNIDFNPLATSVFAIDVVNKNITIKSASIFTGNIKTTGVITLLSGVDFRGIITAPLINQSTPSSLIDLTINGTLTYNTNTNTTITITNCTLGTVRNDGTGMITINKVNSTITNYVDAEINFIDSSISVIGADSVTIHPTANDRNLNQNVSATFTNTYSFKYGSLVNGSTMSGTLYLRCVAGSIPFNVNKTIVLGDNVEDLGMTALLSSLGAKIDTKPTLAQIEASSVLAKKSQVEILNRNTIKASKLIPANENITN